MAEVTLDISQQFRPNPERGVYVSGQVDTAMVAQLTPIIMGLWKESGDPISVYINSQGGFIGNARMIEGMLKARGCDGDDRHIIGVGLGFALSAAADLLIMSDYAIAYPSCQIHCHGSRYTLDRPVTVEDALRYSQDLQENNDDRALRLAEATFKRVLFRFQYLRADFQSVRRHQNAELSDIECFVEKISEYVSPQGGVRLARRALARQMEIDRLSEFAFRGVEYQSGAHAKFEATLLKRVIDFEVKRYNKEPHWCLSAGGFDEISRDYRLLIDYHLGSHHDTLGDLVSDYRSFFVSKAEETKIRQQSKPPNDIEEELERTTRDRMEPIWYYCLFLCRLLMERENPLVPLDAFWLGLIDEVAGMDLPTVRKALETPPSVSEPELPITS